MTNLILLSIALILGGCMPSPNNTVMVRNVPRQPINCPSGYVLLPASSGYTTRHLCIGKYEARIVSKQAVSSPSAAPTVVRKRSEAVAACKANGPKYNLITNLQWQALARNIETTASNWSGGRIGDGALSLGHSDGDPFEAVGAYMNDSDGCYNNGDADCEPDLWHFQKRTFKLSNGQIIWDVAGNLNEWVLDNSDFDFSYMEGTDTITQDIKGSQLKMEFGSSLSSMNGLEPSLNGGLGNLKIDQLFGNYAVGTLRGGSFDSYIESGIFMARINVPAETDEFDQDVMNLGFRCVYEP